MEPGLTAEDRQSGDWFVVVEIVIRARRSELDLSTHNTDSVVLGGHELDQKVRSAATRVRSRNEVGSIFRNDNS